MTRRKTKLLLGTGVVVIRQTGNKPYQESGNIRIFSPQVSSDELEWHVDFEDRIIEVIQSGGWSFQRDNEIPRPLIDGEKFLIEKFEWHRVLKGVDDLVIRVIKISL